MDQSHTRSRAAYPECYTLIFMEFLKSLKCFIVRWGHPEKIYSDNGSTFVAPTKWLRKVLRDERLQDFFSSTSVSSQFNLSRVPWWEFWFELMVGVVKKWLTLQDSSSDNFHMEGIGRSFIRCWIYAKQCNVQMPNLTPNSLIYESSLIPEDDPYNIEASTIYQEV